MLALRDLHTSLTASYKVRSTVQTTTITRIVRVPVVRPV
jgi:hypothetical protein